MRKILALPVVTLSLVLAPAIPAAAAPPTQVIVLPGAISAEGSTAGKGSTFYASDLFGGDVFRGDVRRGTAELFIDAPARAQAIGMDADLRHDLLFVAGGPAKAYIYNTRATVATYDIGDPATTYINDVTLTPYGAWFTDSLQPKLYFVPVLFGIPGPVRTLQLTGPAADPSDFNLNGITSTPSGDTLLVAPNLLGKLCTINPITGASHVVANVDVPNTDGLVLEGRNLWAVQTIHNKITRWHLNGDLTQGTPTGTIRNPEFHIPLTAAKFGNRLAVVNSHLDSGFPPTHPTYEVLVIGA